jgi:hypothetical protein
MGEDGIFYGHLVHFAVFCYILWTLFCIVRGNLVYFSRFGILCVEKSGNPGYVFKSLTRSFFSFQTSIKAETFRKGLIGIQVGNF